jgi:RNA polymerase sigma-70 factor (ECF subfamily)
MVHPDVSARGVGFGDGVVCDDVDVERRGLLVGDDGAGMGCRTWPVTSEAELAACYDETFDELFRYASHLTGDRGRTEDLVAQVYLELVRASRSDEVTSIGMGWLITVARRRFIDRLRLSEREQRRLRLVKPRGEEPVPAVAADGSGELLASLSDRERAAVVLRYVEDLSLAEVARVMETTVRAVESLLARARNRVRRSEVRDA